MYCENCGKRIELLPPIGFCTSKHWYGCKYCKTVIEKTSDSVSGRPINSEVCNLNYDEYMAVIEKNKKENSVPTKGGG